MRLLLGSLFALAIAAAIGLGATWIVLTGGTAYGGVTIGAWTAWPRVGTSPKKCMSMAAYMMRSIWQRASLTALTSI